MIQSTDCFCHNGDCISLGYGTIPTNGTLLLFDPLDACESGNILIQEQRQPFFILAYDRSCYIEDKVKNAQKLGASGIVILTRYNYGKGIWITRESNPKRDVTFIAVEVPIELEQEVLSYLNKVVEIIPVRSPWIDVTQKIGSFVFLSILIGVLNLILIVICTCQLYILRRFKKQERLAFVCNVLLWIGALLRFIACLDFHGSNGVLPFPLRITLITITCPFSVASIFLVGFYWLEVLGKKKLQSGIIQLKNYYLHFTGILIILLVLEVTTSALRAEQIDPLSLSLITVTAYLIVYIFTGIFFVYACYLLWKWLKDTELTNIQNMLHRMFLSGIIQCLVHIPMLIFIITLYLPIWKIPRIGVYQQPLAIFSITMYCFAQIVIFRDRVKASYMKQRSLSASSSSFSTSSSTTNLHKKPNNIQDSP